MRWSYLIPRGLVVASLVLFALFGFDPAARFGLTRLGRLLLGRPVDVATLQTSYWPPRLALSGVAVAEEDRIDQSEFEIGSVTGSLHPDAARQRRLVVDELHLEDVRWNVPADYEPLADIGEAESDGSSVWTDAMTQRATAAVEALVGESVERVREQLDPDRLETVRLSRTKRTEYEAIAASLKTRLETIQTQSLDLRAEAELIRQAPEDFLNPAEIERLVLSLADLREQAREVRSQLAVVRQRLPVDMAELRAAKDRDVAAAKATVAAVRAEPQRMAEAMLSEPVGRAIGLVADWAPRLARLKSSGDLDQVEVVRHRGRDIDFLNRPLQPSLAINHCLVSGTAVRSGREWPFQLELEDIVAAPRSLRQPVAFRWANGGPTQIQAVGTLAIDGTETGLEAHYHIIDTTPTDAGGGSEHRWAVTASSRVIDGSIHLSGDELSGSMSLQLADFAAGVESDRASLTPLMDALAVERPTMTTEVSFSIDPRTRRPTCEIDCGDLRAIAADLGSRSAELKSVALAAAKLEVSTLAEAQINDYAAHFGDELGLAETNVESLLATVQEVRSLIRRPSADAIRQVVANRLDLPPLADDLVQSSLFESVVKAPHDGITRGEVRGLIREAAANEQLRTVGLDAIPEEKKAKLLGRIDDAVPAEIRSSLGGLLPVSMGGMQPPIALIPDEPAKSRSTPATAPGGASTGQPPTRLPRLRGLFGR